MRLLRLVLPVLVGVAAAACGAPQNPSHADFAWHSAPPDAIVRYWVMGAHPKLAAYAALGAFLHTDVGRAIVPAALSFRKDAFTPTETKCILEAAGSVNDVAVGVGDKEADGGLLIVRFDDKAFDPAPCLLALGARSVVVQGATQAFGGPNDIVFVHEPGVMLMGPLHIVKLALQPRATAPVFPPELSLPPDAYAAWSFLDKTTHLRGTVLASSSHFRIDVDGELPVTGAAAAELWFRDLQTSSMTGVAGDDRAHIQKFFEQASVKRDGAHLQAAFDIPGTPADQVRDLATTVSFLQSSVHHYDLSQKSREARNMLGQIAKDYATWFERESMVLPGAKPPPKKLVSLAPVPATVPKGDTYASTDLDWKPWAFLRFEIDSPQRYQYEVRASDDGNSADIFARGDLDGNGKQSELRLHLTVDREHESLTIAPKIEERDPEE
jgi:hypothetical protein